MKVRISEFFKKRIRDLENTTSMAGSSSGMMRMGVSLPENLSMEVKSSA